ncbi:hypothetical protein [Ponticaulis sp.]|uniref:hypothetical protein n=1 Tax=Ponticaulis sp. TaxID=2020902 RepID=UPI000B6DF3F2|nr:hypothetical protein [Ponticaulis sp.]MAI90444.1 hypothetical protein [Ponticaulis sp.]OUY00144.1 MAG: hypothetical protein CBB65_08395 [Hyphomonadaceae bacterium TMED5]|tara:strand:+ start:59994 stop:61343 length:1350 start_codon:yes stop_codon:yes gene_type:complete
MIELLTSLWAYLAGAGIIGLILGWAVRGAFLPRARTVTVTAPETVVTAPGLSAEQREKIQRADELETALQTAQSRMTEMQGLVNSLKADVETAKAENAAVQHAELEVSEDDSRAIWNERYLKSRIRVLEAELVKDADAAPVVSEPVAVQTSERDAWMQKYYSARVAVLESQLKEAEEPVPAGEPEGVVAAERIEAALTLSEKKSLEAENAALKADLEEAVARLSKVEDQPAAEPVPAKMNREDAAKAARLSWQNKYLQSRVTYLENTGGRAMDDDVAVKDASAPVDPIELETLRSEITVLKAELSRDTSGHGDAEQELARLRWRNRYLEGRLKYLEASSGDPDADVEPSAPKAPSGSVAEAAASTATEETRPTSLDAPDGDADDLQRIGGIGPKIELILNELGIFHFSQIAAWTPGEAAWIDSYLRYQGRVIREEWVAQAKELSSGAAA